MLVVGVILCALILLATIGLGRHRRYGAAGLLQVLCFFGPFMCMVVSTPVLLQTIGLAILAVAAIRTEMKPRHFAGWASGITASAFGVSGIFAWNAFQEIVERREEFAFESLDDRLPPSGTRIHLNNDDSLTMEPLRETSTLLFTQEQDLERSLARGADRAQAIRRLHTQTVNKFINSPGFGVTRMRGYGNHLLRTRVAGPIPQPESIPQPYVAEEDGSKVTPDEIPTEERLRSMHVAGVTDFVHAEGFGYRNANGQIAGFEPHHFGEIPKLPPRDESQEVLWRLARVELVSLLKQAEPRIYLSETLPRMQELRDAPSRAVDEFECTAIDRLRAGEDFVTSINDARLRVVGSLRALNQCLDCHQGAHGDLLGAFVYEFRTNVPRSQPDEPAI